MEIRKAIRLIRNLPTMCVFTDAYGDHMDSDAYYEAVEEAVKALEKQEPKKYSCPVDTAYCPVCGYQVEQQHMNGEILIHDFHEYCSNCGQKIGWGSDESKGREMEIIRCRDCKHFELDHWEKVGDIPLIVAHEICMRWGDGCKTSPNGFCFMAEKKKEVEP